MSINATVWFVAVLAVLWPGTSADVVQFPRTLNASIGRNESIFCKFPILQDTADVSWWKEGQKGFIEPDSRHQFNVKKSSSTFTFLNVKYTDVGVYYCQVKSQQQILGNGSGSQLIVSTPPTPLKIIRVEETSPKSRKLLCKTAPFYPKKLDIFWRRNDMEILTKIETAINETSEGSFEAFSTLEDAQPAQGTVVYTCLVSHETLKRPAIFSYIIEQDRENSNTPLISGSVLGGLAFIILIIILAICVIQRTSDEASQSGEPAGLEPVEHNPADATRNVIENKRIHQVRRQDDHVVYTKTRRGGDEKLTYADLHLPNNKIS